MGCGVSCCAARAGLSADCTENFIDGFTHFGRPQELWSIVNEVLPARQLVITPAMLGRVGLALSRIATSIYLSEETRRVAREYGVLLHRRAIAMGYDRVDAYMGPHIETEYVMNRFGDLDAAYERLRAQGVNIGPAARIALVHAFATRDPSRALQVLRWTLGDPKIADPTSPYPFKRFVASIAKSRPDYPYQRIVEALRDRPKGCHIPPTTRALVATMMVEQNRSIKLDDYVKVLIDCAGGSANQRATVLSVVVTRGYMSHSTTEIEARAALELLRDYLTHHAHSQTQSRVERIWGRYLRSVIRSRALTVPQRRAYIREAIALLVDKYGSIRSVTLFNIIEWTLSRRHMRARARGSGETDDEWAPGGARRDVAASDEDTAEALYWWGRLRGMDTEQAAKDDAARNEKHIAAYWWQQVMFALKNAGRVQEAANLVADAWDGNPEADESEELDQYRVFPTMTLFWEAALESGLLAKVGLSEKDVAKAKRVWAGDEPAYADARSRMDQSGLKDAAEDGGEESLDDLEERLAEEAAAEDD